VSQQFSISANESARRVIMASIVIALKEDRIKK
jgi:hypothetical protein